MGLLLDDRTTGTWGYTYDTSTAVEWDNIIINTEDVTAPFPPEEGYRIFPDPRNYVWPSGAKKEPAANEQPLDTSSIYLISDASDAPWRYQRSLVHKAANQKAFNPYYDDAGPLTDKPEEVWYGDLESYIREARKRGVDRIYCHDCDNDIPISHTTLETYRLPRGKKRGVRHAKCPGRGNL